MVKYRSNFELEVSKMLDARGTYFEYEKKAYSWREKIPRAKCDECGGAAYALRHYTPDFFLGNGVIIEAKGRFTVRDRKIALAMKKRGLDVRMVFMFDNRLNKKSGTRYSTWCEKYGIQYAIREIPEDWT